MPKYSLIYSCKNNKARLARLARRARLGKQEHILFIKTRAEHYPKLEKKILDIHPYDVPEIIVLPIIKGSQKYLDWITEETK